MNNPAFSSVKNQSNNLLLNTVRQTTTKELGYDLNTLRKTYPKELRANGKPSTCSIAAAFYQGLIDCESPTQTAPLAAYLKAEGEKRVPAFIFEKIFISRMKAHSTVSEGWYVCRIKETETWFKLGKNQHDWKDIDERFAQLVIKKGMPVWRAWFSESTLQLMPFENHQILLEATEYLGKYANDGNGRVRPMLTTGVLPKKAFGFLDALESSEKDSLIRGRIFINCFLELTGGRPYDIDAICLKDGSLYAAEFKRKYPNKYGYFGLDKHLRTLPKLLDGICPLYHYVLQDKRGRSGKGQDPTTALGKNLDESISFFWRAIELTPEFEKSYPTRKMKTQGTDSGQRGGNRVQEGIPEEYFIKIPNPVPFLSKFEKPDC